MSGQSSTSSLLEPRLVRALDALRLAGRRTPASQSLGHWRSRATGSSVEFSDYRTYTAGDDFRRIDWNAYARLERLFVRLYRAEENLTLAVLLDTSRSMGWGQPSKLRLAAQLAAALSYVALRRDDHVELATLREGGVHERAPRVSGQASAWSVWRFLERLSCGGTTDLDASLDAWARQTRGGGLALVISDLLSPSGYQAGLDALLGHRHEVLVLQVLSPDELAPSADLVGEWRLQDVESSEAVEATITPATMRSYQRLLQTYTREVAEHCRRRGLTYLLLPSSVSIDQVVLRTLRRAGVLV
ncbi:MAG: DUF58 domain-containing protein [Chloroflexota bacterium]|nr:DUF58 domain-containing protein [Chloroflexota bacterium]